MDSLKQAILAASEWRKEVDKEAKDIKFSAAPGRSNSKAVLCHIQGGPEVIVQVGCSLTESLPHAKLFIETGGVRNPRLKPLPNPWFTKVTQGDCAAGAEFDASAAFESAPENFEARPPVHEVELAVKKRP